MFDYPEGLYSDVRIEERSETVVRYTTGDLEELRTRAYRAAFIRVYDGRRWYCSAVSDTARIQSELDSLAGMAVPDPAVGESPVVGRLQVNTSRDAGLRERRVGPSGEKRKQELLCSYFPILEASDRIRTWFAFYQDRDCVKRFVSSLGADLEFGTRTAGIMMGFGMASGERRLNEYFHRGGSDPEDLDGHQDAFGEKLERSREFVDSSVPVKAGSHTVILSPFAAGIFAHESFGHKSEADFMVGDETMMREWAIGSRVGPEMLSIVDDGSLPGTGHTPFDDEGTRAGKTWLIREGILSGRLHSASTAADLGEAVTGNARAVSFEYEPIPRMTTTFIEPGTSSREELFGEVEEGVFVDTVNHGSGLSTFTLAPSMSYMIRNGRIAEPVEVSVITGNVMQTLGDIDGLSDGLEIYAVPSGGCGKMDQAPLPVGFGGPFVRVRTMNVQ